MILIVKKVHLHTWSKSMSTILKFPLERVQRRSFGMHDLSHNAAILVFEGIRYHKDISYDASQTQQKASEAEVN